MLETLPEVHVLDRLAVVFKHLRLIVAVFSVVVAIAMLESYSATPMYQTQARIVIQDERSTAVANLNATGPTYWQDPEPYFNTQYRILQSRGLARRVVRKLPPPPVTGAEHALARAVVSAAGDQPLAEAGARSGRRAGAARTGRKRRGAGRDRRVPRRRRDRRRSRARGSSRSSTPSPDPQYAALAANTLAREYVQANLDLKLANTTNTITWLGDEIAKQRKKVEAAEQAMAEYQEGQNAMSLNEGQNIVIARLNVAERRGDEGEDGPSPEGSGLPPAGESQRRERQRRHVPGRRAERHDSGNQTAARESRNGEKAKLSQRYGANHPEMSEDRRTRSTAPHARLRAETAKVLESIANEYRSAVAEEQNLSASLEDQKRQAIDLNRKSITYSILAREAESERQVYNALLQQEKELRVVSNSRANNVQLMDDAEVPGGPFTPNHSRDWLMALVLGLALGVAVAYTVEYLDDTVKLPDDVTRRLKLPLLGLVPAVGGDKLPVLTSAVPHDFGEAFRSLRTSLVFTNGSPGQADDCGHEHAAARRQDDDGVQPGRRARARRRARDADRRRHAAPRSAPDDGAAERDRAVARPDGAGARARGGTAHQREQPVRDDRGTRAAESVRAAVVRADASPDREPRGGAVRLGHHGHAAGARRDRRGHPRALHVRSRVRRRRGDDARARTRSARFRRSREASRTSSAPSSTASISTATSITTRATTATTTRATTATAPSPTA